MRLSLVVALNRQTVSFVISAEAGVTAALPQLEQTAT
jgi:hypothetical protein